MGATDSRLYYYPGQTAAGSTPLQAIDLGRRVASLDRTPSPVGFGGLSLGGAQSFAAVHTEHAVTIEASGIPTGAVQRQLVALVSHAKRGGVFGFAADHAKFFAAYYAGPSEVAGGDDLSSLIFPFPAWHAWQTSGTLGAGDIIAVESLDGPSEEHEVSSVPLREEVGASVVLDGNVAFNYRNGFLLREKYSFPALVLTERGRTAQCLTSVGDHTWTLRLECRRDAGAIRRLSTRLPGTSGTPGTVIGTPYAPRA